MLYTKASESGVAIISISLSCGLFLPDFFKVMFSFLFYCSMVLFILSSFIPRLIFDAIIYQHVIVDGQLYLSLGKVLPYKSLHSYFLTTKIEISATSSTFFSRACLISAI